MYRLKYSFREITKYFIKTKVMTERNFPPGKWYCKELHKPTSLLRTSLAFLFFCPKAQRCFVDATQELGCPRVSAPDETTPFAAPWEPGMGLVHPRMGQVIGLSWQPLQCFPRQERCRHLTLWHQCCTSSPLIMHWMWPYSLTASHQFLLEKGPKTPFKTDGNAWCLP